MLSTEVVQKLELKLLGISVDEQLRFTTHASNICRKGARLVGMILKLRKLIPTSANWKLSNLQYCHISLPIMMPDARKLEKLQERAPFAVCCNKRIITFGWFAYFTEFSATRKGHGYVKSKK